MNKKILIVGGSAAGASTAVNLRREDEFSQILVIEKGPDISFANCSLPYFFSGEVKSIENLIVNTPEDFKKYHNIDTLVNHEVIEIDRENKKVKIKDLKTQNIFEEYYDKLVLSPGVEPRKPKDLYAKNAFTFRNVEDVRRINSYIEENNVKDIAIIGNGYIGIELAEAFLNGGKNVSIIGSREQVLPFLDEDMVQKVHRELIENGIELILGSRGSKIKDGELILENGDKVKADLYILAIGVVPNFDFIENAGIEIGSSGGILVNEYYRTNDDSIYAIGDAIEVKEKNTGKDRMLHLAFPAHREAKAVAADIYGKNYKKREVIATSILRVFDLTIGSTGMSEKIIKDTDINYGISYMTYNNLVHGNRARIHGKIIFDKDSKKLLGAQIIGKEGADKRLDILATLIFMGGDIDDLLNNERAYSPMYATTNDITNLLGDLAKKTIEEDYRYINYSKVRELVEANEFILDASPEERFKRAHIKNSINIPRDELRDRLDELNKDKTIYVLSLNVYRLLKNRGYDVVQIQGNLKDIEDYEFYKDKLFNREPIIIK